jgi:hypothetical protein
MIGEQRFRKIGYGDGFGALFLQIKYFIKKAPAHFSTVAIGAKIATALFMGIRSGVYGGKTAVEAARRHLELLRGPLESQDAPTLAVILKRVRISACGVPIDILRALEVAQRWFGGHDIELAFTVFETTAAEMRIVVHAVWTDNVSFERCSGRFEFVQRWSRVLIGWKLAAIDLALAERFAPLAAGSKVGRMAQTCGRVLVFTLATRPTPYLDDLAESCRRQGISLQVIGKGAPWKGFTYAKLQLLYWYLTSHSGNIDVALFIDGYDTIFTEGLDAILAKFRRIGSPVLFAAEANCWPGSRGIEEHNYPEAPTRYRFLNAGGWIAELPVMLALLKQLGAPLVVANRCDQAWWARHYLADGNGIQLDHSCEIFQCLFRSTQDLRLQGRRPKNIVTGTLPSVIHANGCISLVPWSDHLLHRYFRRSLARAGATLANRGLGGILFWKRHSPLLRLIRRWKGRAALKAS